MTIYGTPGGTPLNTSGFQGTAPGNAVQATLQPSIPGVGMFPPGSNNSSGDTAGASMGRGALPANTFINNEGQGANNTLMCGDPPGDGGNQAAGNLGAPFGSGAGSGGDVRGAQGGNNMNANIGATGDVVITNQANPNQIVYQGGSAANPQYAG